MRRLLQAVLPSRLGSNFRWIFASTTASNLGDGVLLAAGPLLVASITREPFAVAMAALLHRLPWLVFGVFAGAIVDRLDRRLLIMSVDIFRGTVVAALTVAVAMGFVNLPVIYIAMFLVGTAETFADNASVAIVATAVPDEALGQANSRVFGTHVVSNQLAGPPFGAWLFGLALAAPFGIVAMTAVAGALLMKPVVLRERAEPSVRASMKSDVVEGLRWLWAHAPVRTLAIMITVFNVTFGAAFSVWVLYAYERLGLDAVGFGLLMTASAVGGVAGSMVFRRLEQRFSYAQLLRVGLLIETSTHLILGLTTVALVAGAIMALFGVHAVVWGTTAMTVRQRAVPNDLMGRVNSVYMLGSVGALAFGTLIGGVLAQRWGILMPFWFAFGGSALTTALVWRSLTNVAHGADTDPDPDSAPVAAPV